MDCKEELDEILNALELADFYDLYDDAFYNQVVAPFKEKYKKSFCYDYGATKGVLIFKELGFVVKIPFPCSSDCEFCGADCESGWDYCEVETEKFKMAKENALTECFAETKFVAFINGHPIYMQEYANMYMHDGSSSNHTPVDEEKVENICEENDYECFNKMWLSDVLNYFGESIFYKLMNFIHDTEIRDLHGGNLGYIGMRPVLVDYASFND